MTHKYKRMRGRERDERMEGKKRCISAYLISVEVFFTVAVRPTSARKLTESAAHVLFKKLQMESE